MKILLFFFLLIFSASISAQTIDSNFIKQKIKFINEQPSSKIQKEVNALSLILAEQKYTEFHELIIAPFKELLGDENKRVNILIVLGKTKLPVFDFDISYIAKDIHEIKKIKEDVILNAIKQSGGALTFETVLKTCTTVLTDRFTELGNLKIKLWRILLNKDQYRTITKAFEFYAFPSLGLKELNSNNNAPAFLIELFRLSAENENFLMAISDAFKTFCLADDLRYNRADRKDVENEISLQLGSPNDNRFKVIEVIFNKFYELKTPISLSFIAEFIRSDHPGLRQKALNTDYKKLSDASMFPRFFNRTKDITINKVVNVKFDVNAIAQNLYFPAWSFINSKEFDNTISAKLAVMSNRQALEASYSAANTSHLDDLKSRFSFTSLQPVKDVKSFLDPGGPGYWIPEYSNNFFDFHSFHKLVTYQLSETLKKDGYKPGTSDSTAILISGRNLEQQALLSYSIALFKNQFQLKPMNISLQNLDAEYKKILAAYGNKVLETKVVSTLLKRNPVKLGLNNTTITRFKVTARRIALSEGVYEETLSLTDKNNKTYSVKWFGVIPIHFLPVLIRYPRMFDNTSYSFAIKELSTFTSFQDFYRSEIDYITFAPVDILPYLFNFINGKSSHWTDVKEQIIFFSNSYHNFSDYSIAVQRTFAYNPPTVADKSINLKPLPNDLDLDAKNLLTSGFPGGVFNFAGIRICESDSVYDRMRLMASQMTMGLMIHKTYKKINEILLDNFKRTASDKKPCHWLDVFCHTRLIMVDDKTKGERIRNYEANIDKLARVTNYFSSWDLSNLMIDENSKVYLRQLLLSPGLKKFSGLYEIRSGETIRYINLEGTIPDVPKEILIAIEQDPLFLNKYSLDLTGATKGAGKKLSSAIYRSYNGEYMGGLFYELLKKGGLDYIRPWVLGFVPRGPLLKSEEGKIYATELNYYNQILKAGLGGVLTDDNSPSPQFIKTVQDFWFQAARHCETKAIESAQYLINAANQGSGDWEIYLGFKKDDQGNGQIMITVSVGDISVSLSSSPKWEDMQLSLKPRNETKTAISFNLDNLFAVHNHFKPAGGLKAEQKFKQTYFSDIPTYAAISSIVNTRYIASVKTAHSIRNTTLAAVRADPPIGNIETRIPRNWVEITPWTGPGPWKNAPESGDRAWLYSMIIQARTKLTDKEVAQLWESAKSGFFPDPLVDILIKRRNEALEEENIKDGNWIRTDVPESGIIPDEVNRNGSSVEEYIKDYNKTTAESFGKQAKEKIDQLETKQIYEDGLPALKISYSKDFEYQLWTYTYKCIDGSTITTSNLSKAWPGIVAAIKKNPNGHVLEKLTTLAAQDIVNLGSTTNPLRRAEIRKVKDLQSSKLDPTTFKDAAGKSFKIYIEGHLREYFKNLKEWLKDNSNSKEGVATPFKPTPEASPLLNLFPPPYDSYIKKREAINAKVNQCRDGNLIESIEKGRVVIKPRL